MGTELECGRDAAAYVLGALDESEALAFRLHMAGCPACREEVDLLESAAAALPMMVPQHQPPGTLRASVISEVRRDARRAQLGAGGPRATSRGGRNWAARPVPRSAIGALAALVVLAVVLVIAIRPAGTRVIRGETAYGGAKAAIELTGGRGQLLLEDMPAPPAGKVYEVWVARAGHAPAATDALFDVDDAGDAAVDVPGPLAGGDVVMVTAEPPGGTKVPTLPVLIEAKL